MEQEGKRLVYIFQYYLTKMIIIQEYSLPLFITYIHNYILSVTLNLVYSLFMCDLQNM